MGHFPKGICPVMSNEAYPDQPRDQRSVSHSSILLFPSGQVGEKLYVQRASLLCHACLSHLISCGLRSLEEEIHIESDCTVKQTNRTEFAVRAEQSPIQMKKQQEPIKPRKFHLSRDLLTDRTFYEGSLVLREKHMFTPLYLIFRDGKYYHSSKQISW